MKEKSTNDPKGLIKEAYQIDGISLAECRSIFLDWALSLSEGTNTSKALSDLVDIYGQAEADHPMTSILQEGLTRISVPRRRGGWRSRPRS